MSRLVVTDTGPLIHLSQAGVLPLLGLTGEIPVPGTVLDELERGPVELSELEFAIAESDVDTESIYPHLDPGETAALVLCTERDAVLLTDDLDARTTAQNEGIEVHGSVGVVLSGYSRGELSEQAATDTLRDLKRDTNLYLSTPLVEHAIELVESDDAGWYLLRMFSSPGQSQFFCDRMHSTNMLTVIDAPSRGRATLDGRSVT